MIKLIGSTFYNEAETKKKLCEFIQNAQFLSLGPTVKKFEEEFASYQGRKFAVMFNSGSSANLAIIQALVNIGTIKKEAHVGFSSLTWATNVMPLMQLNLNPVPIDVSLKNLNVDSENLNRTLENTKLDALFLTNLLGFSANIDKIKQICDEKGIVLIEDNCESLGSEVNSIKLGNFSIASTFSFFVGHHMSTIEGGMVCTDDEKIYEMLMMVRSHGWDRNVSDETKKELREKNSVNDFHAKYTFYSLAYNLRPTEINGFIGLEQLKYIQEIVTKREANFQKFDAAVKENNDFEHFDLSHMSFVSNFSYPLICKDAETAEQYKKKFEERNVEIRPIVGGSMVEQPFFTDKKISCDNAKRIHTDGFYFPNHPELTDDEITTIISLLKG